MLKRQSFILVSAAILALAWMNCASAAQETIQSPAEGDEEYLLRGPLHEAFAEPVTFDPQPGLVVPKAPPEPVPEMPPEIKPDSDAVWVSGYWAWDDQRADFIWVSGVYRVFPPGQRWVPGYWRQTSGGHQWVPGFWTPAVAEEVEYLPVPPETLEQGPSSPAPSDDHFWINGCWEYQNDRYLWRTGYWAAGYDGWVWIPAHYTWTPYGCIYVPGYWDYQLVDRGMCFAPVYFRTTIYTRPGYYYNPCRVIDLGRLYIHLFVRPSYCHYYFGDWYGAYDRFGIYASFNFHGHRGYDPIWSYDRWHFHRQGIDYENRVRGWHEYFDRHEDRRPPHTWHDQQRFVEKNRGFEHLQQVVLADDVKQLLSKHDHHVKPIGDDVRREMHDSAALARDKLVEARRTGESKTRPTGPGHPGSETFKDRLKLPETPDLRHVPRQTADRSPSVNQQRLDRTRMPDFQRGGDQPNVRLPAGEKAEAGRPGAPERKLPDNLPPQVRETIERARAGNLNRAGGKPDVTPSPVQTPGAAKPAVPELKLPDNLPPQAREAIERARAGNLNRAGGKPDVTPSPVQTPDAAKPAVPELKLPDNLPPQAREAIERARAGNLNRAGGRPDVTPSPVQTPDAAKPAAPGPKLPDNLPPQTRAAIEHAREAHLNRAGGQPTVSPPAVQTPKASPPAAPQLKLPDSLPPQAREAIERARAANLNRINPQPQPNRSPSTAPSAPKLSSPQVPAVRNPGATHLPQPTVKLPEIQGQRGIRAGSAAAADLSRRQTGRAEASPRIGRAASPPKDNDGGRGKDK